MKSSIVVWIILILLTAFVVAQYDRLNRVQAELEALKSVPTDRAEHGELVLYMQSLQQFLNKLWFSGIEGNTELALFYHHEVEEVVEELISDEIENDGHAVSVLVGAMLQPAVNALEIALNEGDSIAFQSAYLGVVNACNACHQVTDHGMIEIALPRSPYIDNQNFGTVSSSLN